jgi:hypothetical protein
MAGEAYDNGDGKNQPKKKSHELVHGKSVKHARKPDGHRYFYSITHQQGGIKS